MHQTTTPYTPQQNGIAERKNRTLKDMVNSMLNSSGLPHYMWREALLTANTILNRIPHKKTSESPYELWKGKIASYKKLKVWGCLAKVQVPLPKRTKLGPKTIDCVFIGYASNSSTYRFLVIKYEVLDINNNIIMKSIDVEFFEEIFPFKERHNEIIKIKIDDSLPKTQHEQRNDVEPRRSKRARTNTSFGPDFITFLTEVEPQTYTEAMSTPEAPYWQEAVNDEINSIIQNHT